MRPLHREIRRTPLLWSLAFVPAVFVLQPTKPEAHTLLFGLSVLAIVTQAALLSHATESVAARIGDAVGLLEAPLGTPTELVIALAARRVAEDALVTRILRFLRASRPADVALVFAMTPYLLPQSGT